MVRRKVSIPILVATVVAVAVAAGGFHLIRQWQLARLSQTLLALAQAEERKEAWLEAASHLDRYLRLQPRNSSARVQLALTYARGATSLAEKQRAVALHYRALASQAGDQQQVLRAGLAELLLETGRLIEAESESKQVVDEDPEDARSQRVYALSRFLQWRGGALATEEPRELRMLENLERALDKNPHDITLAEVTATLYREFPEVVAIHKTGLNRSARNEIADKLIDRVVKGKPDDAKAYLSRYAYRVKYNLPDASKDLEQALKLAPDDPQTLLVAAGAHYREATRLRDNPTADSDPSVPLEAARRIYRRIVDEELALDNPEAHLRLGDVLVLEDRLDEALAAWRSGGNLFHKPTVKVLFHARIADHLIYAGRIAEAKHALEAIDSILSDIGGTIRRGEQLALMQAQGLRRATYMLHEGRYSDAVVELQQAIARQPQLQPNPKTSHDAWFLLGRGFAGLEDWTAAATAFDRAANFRPQEVHSRLAAAESWLAAGRAELAIDRAEQVILAKGLPEAWIILATAELQVQAMAAPSERVWDRMQNALQALERIESSDGIREAWRIDFLRADYTALSAQAALEAAQGRAAAADVLRVAELKHQDKSQFWFEACLAYERLGQPADAERALEKLNELPGAHLDAVIAASRRAAMHEDYAQATQILEEGGKTIPLADHVRLRQEMYRIAQAKQDLPAMKALLIADLRERPGDVGILCRLAELDLREGNLSGLRKWEEQLGRLGSLGELWARYFRVVRLLSSASGPDDPQLREALSQQSQLATLRPNWAEAYSLRGMILQRMDTDARRQQAVTAYEQAIQLGERRFLVYERLITCLDQLKRSSDVEKYLARLESHLPTSQRLTALAVKYEYGQERPEQALHLARQRAERDPSDLSARLWLGYLLLATKRYSEAYDTFLKATQDAPEDVRTWNGLFAYYLRAGEKDRALEVLDSIRRHADLDPIELDVVLGDAYLRLGDKGEAMRLFAALSQQAPDRAEIQLQLGRLYLDSDREKAKEHLQRAIQIDPKSPARDLLAEILAAGGSEAELAQLEELLGGLDGQSATVEDRRMRALLMAHHGNAEDLERATAILEEIVASNEGRVNDRLLLAQFYERLAEAAPDEDKAAAHIKAARQQLEQVANRSKAQTGELAILIRFLLRHDERAEAENWLVRMETRIREQPRRDPRAIAQVIDLRIKHGSLEQCDAWIAELESIDNDPVRPLIAKVRYLAAMGQNDEIESTIEDRATTALEAAKEPAERTRIARAIGDLYLTVNHLDGAERWYRIVMREDRDQFPLLAMTLMRKGRTREAVELCEAATEYDSSSRPAVVLTRILLQAGGKVEDIALAEPMLAAALKKFPDDVELLYGVGMLRVMEDRYPDAITLLEKVTKLNERHIAALNNLSVLLAETPDQREQAMTLIDRAIELRGQQPTLLDTKGTILVLNGRSTEAVSLLEAAARKDADPRHKFHLALAYTDVGSSERAEDLLKTALEGRLREQILTPTDHKSLDRLKQDLDVSTP